MAVFLAWSPGDVPVDLAGPWSDLRYAAPGLTLIDSPDTLSRVYHELKWSLPDGTPLIVSPVLAAPKFRGLAPGTLTWLRARL